MFYKNFKIICMVLLFGVLIAAAGCDARDTYTVSFESNGGTNISSVDCKNGEIPTGYAQPVKEGYTFSGWFLDNGTFNRSADSLTADDAKSDLTLYAKWTVNSYTISFDSKGGGEVQALTAGYGSTIGTPMPPEKEGYVFDGWFSDDGDFLDRYHFSLMPAQDFTLYAHWTLLQWTITFVSNGGSETDAVTLVPAAPVTEPSPPTKEGAVFGGWYTDDGAFQNAFVFDFMPNGNVTLYAQWLSVTQGLVFTLMNEGTAYAVSGGTADQEASIIVPSTHNQLPVVKVDDLAFAEFANLTEIELPDTIEEIGENAFLSCSSLISITLPEDLTSIGERAFYYCTALTEINIPQSVCLLGESAFGDCSSLASATLPNLSSIPANLFVNCSALASITLPSGLISIGYAAFYGCASLTSISIPSTVTQIEWKAFYNCALLADVYFDRVNPPQLASGGVFLNFPVNFKIYVPQNSVNTYKTAQYWTLYASYITTL